MTNRRLGSLLIEDRLVEFGAVVNSCVATQKDGSPMSLERAIDIMYAKLTELRDGNRKVFIVGNGGSSSVASHSANDFLNVAKIGAMTLHEAAMLTCHSNDYGYENAYARMLDQLMKKDDMLIAISSSGRSPNIINATQEAARKCAFVVTLSGFQPENPLRSTGDLNFWLSSSDYGLVEIGHQFILHNLADRFKADVE